MHESHANHTGPECPKWICLERQQDAHTRKTQGPSRAAELAQPLGTNQPQNKPPPPPRIIASQLDCDVTTCLTPSLSLSHSLLSLMTHPPLMPYQEEQAVQALTHVPPPALMPNQRDPKACMSSTQPHDQHLPPLVMALSTATNTSCPSFTKQALCRKHSPFSQTVTAMPRNPHPNSTQHNVCCSNQLAANPWFVCSHRSHTQKRLTHMHADKQGPCKPACKGESNNTVQAAQGRETHAKACMRPGFPTQAAAGCPTQPESSKSV